MLQAELDGRFYASRRHPTEPVLPNLKRRDAGGVGPRLGHVEKAVTAEETQDDRLHQIGGEKRPTGGAEAAPTDAARSAVGARLFEGDEVGKEEPSELSELSL